MRTVKRNEVCLLLHENLGGGFSPPAAHKIRRLGRKARSGIDRTPYKTDRKISFVSYHTRSISMNITRAEAWQLHKAVNTAKGNLCRHLESPRPQPVRRCLRSPRLHGQPLPDRDAVNERVV